MAGLYHFLVNQSDTTLGGHRCAMLHELVPCLSDINDISPSSSQAVLCNVMANGPGGNAGVLVYPRPPHGELPQVLKLDLSRQEWMQVGDGSVRWIGWVPGDLPSPADLERQQTYAGYLVTDEQGCQWSVPIARSPAAQLGSLPKDFVFDENGEPVTVIKSEFDGLWKISQEVWDYFNSPEDFKRDDPWLIKRAAETLSVNYRLGPQEINAMRKLGHSVLDSNTVRNVLLALIDYELVTVLKKKEQPGNGQPTSDFISSTTGDEEESQATVPVSAN